MVSITTNREGGETLATPGPNWARILIVALLLTAIAVALRFGLTEKLSLSELRLQRGVLVAFVHVHPWQSLALYLLLYTALVTFSLPGALVMTLAGGFLFGTVGGGLAAVFAVSLGSVLMYLAAHTALGDNLRLWLTRRSPLLQRLENEVRRHPFTSTLTLRLIPAAPIFLVNLAAGFVRMPLLPYALATVVGVIPSTFLYAWIGQGLDNLFATIQPGSLMSVIRTELAAPVLGLLCLAAVPLAARLWLGRRVAQRHAVK
jgi:uncharacterized membrane protein YdjX (TVP38/TMEM64 family)